MSQEQAIEPTVQYDSSGVSTGIEAELPLSESDAAEMPSIDEPFDPAKIDVVTRTPTVSLLLARLKRGVLDLTPDFQRRAGIWTEVAQSRLIESILLRIPLPTLYAAESGEDSWVIVDGIQRLTTIARFVEPGLVENNYESKEPLKLQGLEYLTSYEGSTFEELPGNLKTRIEETELLVHLIRSGTPEPVKFNIFARINTGGLPLTPQEMRHALIAGSARDLLADLAGTIEFRTATGLSVRTDRMQDREMVLRFLAFLVQGAGSYPGDLDRFLREAMVALNGQTPSQRAVLVSQFKTAMTAANQLFGVHAFRKRNVDQPDYRQPVNKALFEAVAVNLTQLSDSQLLRLSKRKQRLNDKFIELMSDRPFFNAISVGTGDSIKVRIRFDTIEKLFKDVLA